MSAVLPPRPAPVLRHPTLRRAGSAMVRPVGRSAPAPPQADRRALAVSPPPAVSPTPPVAKACRYGRFELLDGVDALRLRDGNNARSVQTFDARWFSGSLPLRAFGVMQNYLITLHDNPRFSVCSLHRWDMATGVCIDWVLVHGKICSMALGPGRVGALAQESSADGVQTSMVQWNYAASQLTTVPLGAGVLNEDCIHDLGRTWVTVRGDTLQMWHPVSLRHLGTYRGPARILSYRITPTALEIDGQHVRQAMHIVDARVVYPAVTHTCRAVERPRVARAPSQEPACRDAADLR